MDNNKNNANHLVLKRQYEVLIQIMHNSVHEAYLVCELYIHTVHKYVHVLTKAQRRTSNP